MKKNSKKTNNKPDGYKLLGIVHQKVLNLFIGNDEYRTWMNTPFVVNDYAVATNSRQMVRLPNKYAKITTKLPEHRSGESIMSVIPTKKNSNLIIGVEHLKDVINKVPKIDEYENATNDGKCEECDGNGKVEWEYEMYTRECDCPVCDGTGIIEVEKRIKTGKKVLDENYIINIENFPFNVTYLELLIKVADLLEVKNIELYAQMPNGTNKFIIGDAEILVMALNPTSEQEYTVVQHYA